LLLKCGNHHFDGCPSLRVFSKAVHHKIVSLRCKLKSSEYEGKSPDFDGTNAQLCKTGKAG
jgi:hypothetical protein